jgi:hypothetical protein
MQHLNNEQYIPSETVLRTEPIALDTYKKEITFAKQNGTLIQDIFSFLDQTGHGFTEDEARDLGEYVEQLYANLEEQEKPSDIQRSPEKSLSTAGYSTSAQHVIETINAALAVRERSVHGRSFVDFVRDNRTYVTSHEMTRLERDVCFL